MGKITRFFSFGFHVPQTDGELFEQIMHVEKQYFSSEYFWNCRRAGDKAPPRAPEAACGEAAAAADEGDAPEEGDAVQRKRRLPKPFDMSRYAQRLVALELCYAGWAYHGFASQGCAPRRAPRRVAAASACEGCSRAAPRS